MDILIIFAITIVIVSLFVGVYIWYKRKMYHMSDELTLLKKEKEYYSEAMMILSEFYTIVYANKTAKNIFGLDHNYQTLLNAKNIQLKIDNTSPDDFFNVLKRETERKEDTFHLRNVLLVMNGKMTQVNIYIDKSKWNVDKTISCVIDMKVKSEIEPKNVVSETGTIDYLTGLQSQFSALSDMNNLSVKYQNTSDTFTIFLLGIDHFNDLQTALGLGYTNRILKSMAQYFIDHPTQNMKIYRMDGDKFMVLTNNIKEEDEVRKIARNIMVSVGNIYKNNNDIHLTTSIGIASYPKDGTNATKLIDNAYIALNKAQIQGESNFEFFTDEYQIVHADEVKMNEDILKGLKKNQFLLHYQPIFDLDGEIMIGAEALLRWKHPEHGLISADKFLHIAEKTGLIVELGEYVFNEAIQQRQHCEKSQDKNFKITINLSLKEMQIEALIPRLEMLFDKYKIDRSMINLDISESAAIENIDKTANDLKLLKDFGISLSLDHFGAGYSSFKYLSLLPIDMIKIDRGLIYDLTLNLRHQKMVKGMIDLAHTLGYKVVAEGVETSQEAAILHGLRCDYAQGYLYSRPISKDDFEALLN